MELYNPPPPSLNLLLKQSFLCYDSLLRTPLCHWCDQMLVTVYCRLANAGLRHEILPIGCNLVDHGNNQMRCNCLPQASQWRGARKWKQKEPLRPQETEPWLRNSENFALYQPIRSRKHTNAHCISREQNQRSHERQLSREGRGTVARRRQTVLGPCVSPCVPPCVFSCVPPCTVSLLVSLLVLCLPLCLPLYCVSPCVPNLTRPSPSTVCPELDTSTGHGLRSRYSSCSRRSAQRRKSRGGRNPGVL